MINYDRAFERLQEFVDEQPNWDGLEGRPAKPSVAFVAKAFLQQAQALGAQMPSITLGNSGHISVIWKNAKCNVVMLFSKSDTYSGMMLAGRELQKHFSKCEAGTFPVDIADVLRETFLER